MRALNLYKSRKCSTVKLNDGKTYKLPNEYTVEEVERLLELRAEQEALETQEVTEEEAQLNKFWVVVFDQIEIIFQHYQPEVTSTDLKKLLTHNEALEILGFFDKYRHQAIKEINQESEKDSKKKVIPATRELRDLRRLLAFMVTNGFSLLELRQLYIDELYFFYDELIFNLEKDGKLKEGSYAKIKSVSDASTNAKETVNLLRKQMFNSIAKKQR